MTNPWKTRKIEKIYDNPWISVTHREVLTPTGTEGIYGMVHFKNLAIGIVPLDEHYNTWLVGQYRYTLEKYSWEIPEGGCPLGSSPLAAAQRELKEETGISASNWEKILDFHTSNSVTNESGMSFLATNLHFGSPEPEETEQLTVKKLPFDKAFEMVLSGEITDFISIGSLFKVKLLLDQKLI